MSNYRPIEQSFKVAYEYKLHFTEHIFSMDNPLFKDIVQGYNSKGDVKVLFVIDSGVLACHPNLSKDITSYCTQNNS